MLKTYFEHKKPDAEAWIIKGGANGAYINQIASEIPDAKFLHLLRDGRAVLNSRMKTIKPYGKGETMSHDPLTSARYWKSYVNRIDAFNHKFQERLPKIT
ncbi:MAG: sulfotransferase [Deltaproteobacteria bacterium]|nr:sulfotransferase [Deltaproteobacteria bacterium]